MFFQYALAISVLVNPGAILSSTTSPAGDGAGKRTGFTNSEEEGVKLTDIEPYLLEDELQAKGGHYSKGADWGSYVVKEGMLITSQNPAISEEAAK